LRGPDGGTHHAPVEIGLVLDLAVKLAVLGFALVPVVRPESSSFAGKAMGFRAVLYPATTLLIPGIWLLAGQPSPYPVLADIAFGLPFLVDAAANGRCAPAGWLARQRHHPAAGG
jgi:hypothetical protein